MMEEVFGGASEAMKDEGYINSSSEGHNMLLINLMLNIVVCCIKCMEHSFNKLVS